MPKANQIYTHRINRVIDYVNNHLEKPISLDELAKVALFSPFHFHRIFVAVTGESVHFFTNRLRLEKATRLLRFSKNSISDVANDCGFSSPSTFSRAFKQYFDQSPSAYKKTGKIEKSKIRKELFPLEAYLEPMSETALKNAFPVEIKKLAFNKVAYLRVVDAYREGVVLEAFKKMSTWAKECNLFEHETIFGMSIDDPMVTPKEKYRYEVCITLPDDFAFDLDDSMETMTMPNCNYAVTHVSGNINRVATATNYLFNTWLVNSDYEPAHQHGIEIYLDNDKVCNWDHFDLHLCIPILNLKK